MPTSRQAADLVVVNATIRTMDTANSVVSALAARDGRVVALGDTAEIAALADGETRKIDARGRTVLPGFIDGHVHFNTGSLISAYLVDFLRLNPGSVGDVLSAVRRQSSSLPVGSWVRADNLNKDHLTERRLPTRRELDEAAPHHPAVVYTIGLHVASANSLALQRAGIDRDTADPAGGAIERDAAGELTGVLHERGKLRLDPRRADTVIPRYDLDQRCHALRLGFGDLLEHGVTSIHDVVVDPEEIRAYQVLRAAGDLRVRVQLLIRGVESQMSVEQVLGLGLQQGFGDEWLKLGGIKMSVDGVCVARNAAVYEPYPGELDNHGIVRIPQEELNEKVLLCHRAGMRVAIHAIGPRAVDMALEAIEKALAAVPRSDHRHRIEHAYLPGPAGQLDRIARLGVVASPQPSFLHGLGDGWVQIWGEQRLPHVMPLRSMLDHGLRVTGSTDYPCVPLNPFLGVKTAVTRRTRAGTILGPNEAISVEEALRLQTTGAAYGGFEEHLKGSLALGRLADLVVVSDDPFAVPPEEIDRLRVETTVVGGEVVFERA